MDSSGPGEYDRWERGNIRSTRRGRLIGSTRDEVTGDEVDVYSIANDEFDGTMGLYQEHCLYHSTRFDPSCVYCMKR